MRRGRGGRSVGKMADGGGWGRRVGVDRGSFRGGRAGGVTRPPLIKSCPPLEIASVQSASQSLSRQHQ